MTQMNGFMFLETKSLRQRKEMGSRSPPELTLTLDGQKTNLSTIKERNAESMCYGLGWAGIITHQIIDRTLPFSQ